MKIKGWQKLSGITFKDYCIINPIHNAQETIYYADVMNLVTKNRLGLQLEMEEVFEPLIQGSTKRLILKDVPRNITIQRMINLVNIQNISSFRQIVEMCIDDYLRETEQIRI